MAHTLQERYSTLVDAKLRQTLVTKNGVIFNSRYEGNPAGGMVKIPVRDTEVTVNQYSKTAGATATFGDTAYINVPVDKDYAVNEIIDGFDAAAVPDNIVADRLDSAGYSLGLLLDKEGLLELEKGTAFGSTTALTKTTVYESFVDMRTALSNVGVPNQGRWAIVAPDVFGLILKSAEFIAASNLGDEVKQTGALGMIAGFAIFESNNMNVKTEVLAGHPDWACRVEEWQVPVKVQDLSSSGKYIGACAVQGRKVYTHKLTKPACVLVKKKA